MISGLNLCLSELWERNVELRLCRGCGLGCAEDVGTLLLILLIKIQIDDMLFWLYAEDVNSVSGSFAPKQDKKGLKNLEILF